MKIQNALLLSIIFMVGATACQNKSDSINGPAYYKAQSFNIALKDVKDSSNRFKEGTIVDLPSTGNQKMLVIPVDFTDYPSSYLDTEQELSRDKINDVFFGKEEDTAYESVKTYYEKSSYGKLHLDGFVSDWFHYDKTFAEASISLRKDEDPTWAILRSAIEWYKEQSVNLNWPSANEFDQNKDGYIDAVWLVYSAPFINGASSSFQWAFTFWDYMQPANLESPVANTYSWGSYYFIAEGGYKLPDAHTFVHETGHLLGLEDYYSYDYRDWGAVGLLDMMDGNIGDHNAYSKSLLNWTTPYIVEKPCSITLKPFADSGDFIILGNDWNGSMYDEYLMIEYYTPFGLNAFDSLKKYTNSSQMFTECGVKVYHIDSRLGIYRIDRMTEKWQFMKYTDKVVSTFDSYSVVMASNTASRSMMNKDHKLIHLLEATGYNSLKDGHSISAKNKALFQKGDDFGITKFKNFQFHDGSKSPLSFVIDELNEDGATITFTVNK